MHTNNEGTLSKTYSLASVTTIIGAFCSLFISVGFMNAWGVWQEYYHKNQLRHRSEFDIAWIGSFATFVLMFGGAAAGILVDKVGPTVRHLWLNAADSVTC